MSSASLRYCVLALISVTSVRAQTQPAGRAFPIATWPTIITAEVGEQHSLGYEPLHLGLGIGLEKRVGRWLELDPSVSWSPDRNVITHDGNTVSVRAEGVMWSGLRQNLGIAGGFGYSHLWTSQFGQSGFNSSLGMAARLHPWAIPSRLYLSYLIPYNGYDMRTGLANSRSQGPDIYFEGQLTTRFRLGLELAAYHFFGQANNPACDISSPCYGPPACSRPGHWGAEAVMVLRLTPRQSTGELY